MKTDINKLVVYFSHVGDTLNVGKVNKGNNEILAEYIGDYMKADLFRLEDPTQYPESYKHMKEVVRNMKYAKKRPKPVNGYPNLDKYDLVFLIFPIWEEDMPMIIHTFIENNDFTNKTLIPVCTHESSGICNTYQYIKEFIVEANVIVTDFCMLGTEARKPTAKKIVEDWLKSLGY